MSIRAGFICLKERSPTKSRVCSKGYAAHFSGVFHFIHSVFIESFLEEMMTTKTRRALKFVNQAMYVLSIAMVIASMMLSLAVKPAMAATGSVWTTDSTCSVQDKNHYYVGEEVWFDYNTSLASGTYTWKIAPTDDDDHPIASGSFTVPGTPTCQKAAEIPPGVAHTLKFTILDSSGKKVKSDNLTIDVPGMSITKTVTSSGPYDSVGDVINYRIVISNTGDVDLTNVTLADQNAGIGSCTATLPATLATRGSITCSASHTVQQADLDAGSYNNTATADSDQTAPVSASAAVTLTQTRTMSVDKTKTGPLSGTFAVGDVFNYTITVTNTGNVTLPGVTVTDSSAIVGSCDPDNGSSLAPGATMTCAASHQVTKPDIDSGTYLNTATGTSGLLTGSDSVTVTLLRNPALTIKKSVVTPPPYQVNDTVTY
jgi:hypothetical protein